MSLKIKSSKTSLRVFIQVYQKFFLKVKFLLNFLKESLSKDNITSGYTQFEIRIW